MSLVMLVFALAAGPLAVALLLLNGLSLVGMIYLLSDQAMSRKTFIFCIAAIALGKGLFARGALVLS